MITFARLPVRVIIFSVVGIFLLSAPLVLANNAEYRRCEPGAACVIGEFLYDDSYVPITTAACTLTSRNEAGTVVINNAAMSSTADGWYSYSVNTALLAEGLYRTQVCCTVSADNLCLDKSFIVGPSFSDEAEVADAVWDETRADHNTAGSFGENLQNAGGGTSSLTAADIWSYPTRTLSSFGSLVADIWGYVSRTLTGAGLSSGSLATKSDVEGISTTVNNLTSTTVTNSITNQISGLSEQLTETQETLEEINNEPIVLNLIEEGSQVQSNLVAPQEELQTKLQRTRQAADRLTADIQSAKSRLSVLVKTWDHQATTRTRSELSALSSLLGAATLADDDAKPDSFNAQIRWLGQSWDSPVVDKFLIEGDRLLASAKIADLKLNTSGAAANLQAELESGYHSLSELEKILGSSADPAGAGTLFGYLRQLELVAGQFDRQDRELDRFYSSMNSFSRQELTLILDSIQKQVLEINVVPSALVVFENSATKDHPENRAFALRGVIEANRRVMARPANLAMVHTWLENGSVIFKFLVTNPSKKLTQKVAVKFQLPKELKLEDIMKTYPGLEVKYDPALDALVVTGEIKLQPEETIVLSVEAQDIWKVSEGEIDALRKQAETLFEPLQNTSYFAQGATLKADIEVALDRIEDLQAEELTPEGRIRAYRQAELELKGVEEKMDSLKTLVSAAGSTGTVFGFVGGVQTLAVWGLVLILVAGFVFLGLYMRMLMNLSRQERAAAEPLKEAKKVKETKPEEKKPKPAAKEKSAAVTVKPWVWVFLGVLFTTLVGIVAYLLLNQRQELVSPLGEPTIAAAAAPPLAPATTPEPATASAAYSPLRLKTIKILVPSGVRAINVRAEPDPKAKIVNYVFSTQIARKLDQLDGWVQVEFERKDAVVTGWVSQDLIQED